VAKKTARKKTAAKATKAPKDAAVREDRPKRLLDLVVLLLGSRHPVSYREIRAQFRAYRTAQEEAGLRAFERDKADLLELGVPLRYLTPEDDESLEEAGYVVDLRRYRMPTIHLTPAEVAALVLAGSVARAAPGTTYAEVVDLALKKLSFDQPLPDSPPAPRPPAELIVHFPRTEDAAQIAEKLATLEHAIGHRKKVTFAYVTAATGQSKARDVDPYGLAYRDATWLLVGGDNAAQGSVKSFRLDRMTELTEAAKPKTPDFERPPGFDLRSYTSRSPWTFEVEPPIQAELEIRPEAGALANEDFGPAAKKETLADGRVRVRFPCTNPDHVVVRVLEHKGQVTVRGPAALRARVREELERVAEKYAT
jgi:predicted DNA-binding transcriptional regulator YafY